MRDVFLLYVEGLRGRGRCELRLCTAGALGRHLHDLLHVEYSARGRPARVALVIVVHARTEVAVVTVVDRWPEEATALRKDVAPIGCRAWIDVVVHLFALLPEQRSAVLERPSSRRNRVLTTNKILTS